MRMGWCAAALLAGAALLSGGCGSKTVTVESQGGTQPELTPEQQAAIDELNRTKFGPLTVPGTNEPMPGTLPVAPPDAAPE